MGTKQKIAEAKNCPARSKIDFQITMLNKTIKLIIDSAASHYISNDNSVLIEYKVHQIPNLVNMLDASKVTTLTLVWVGHLPVMFQVKENKTVLVLKNVEYVPDAVDNIISVNRFNEQFKTHVF